MAVNGFNQHITILMWSIYITVTVFHYMDDLHVHIIIEMIKSPNSFSLYVNPMCDLENVTFGVFNIGTAGGSNSFFF